MTTWARGPIEDGHWNETLEGFVVDPGPPPRLHGYDVWHDLGRHYGFAEVAATALTGDVPDEAYGRAFDLALTLASPGSIAEAPAHAAAIARMLAAPAASVVAMAATVLAESAHAMLVEHGAWLAWLAAPTADPPSAVCARSEADRQSTAVARELVDPRVCPVLATLELTTDATILALMFACGVRTPAEIVGALVTARLPAVIAEAERHRRAHLRTYPLQLPPFDYEEDGP